jgi:hypothetical protein
MKNISIVVYQHGEQKRNINCDALNQNAWTPTHSKDEERLELPCLPSRENERRDDASCRIKRCP